MPATTIASSGAPPRSDLRMDAFGSWVMLAAISARSASRSALRERRGGALARRRSSRCSSVARASRSEEHTSELQSQSNLVCRLLLEKKKHDPVPRLPGHLHDRLYARLADEDLSGGLGHPRARAVGVGHL